MARPVNAPALSIPELTLKLYDADADLRYMSLSDLQSYFLNPLYGSTMLQDYNGCSKLVDGFLHTLNDRNGEVQNQTLKCIGPFVNKMHPTLLTPMLIKFTDVERFESGDPSISALAVRAIVVSLPRPSPGVARTKAVVEAYSAVSKVLIPRLLGYQLFQTGDHSLMEGRKGLLENDLEQGVDSNAIDVLTEVARCFGPMLRNEEVIALQKMSLKFVESERTGSVMKKKAVNALSTISHFFTNEMLSMLMSHIIESFRNSHLPPSERKIYITVLGSIAKAIPTKFGPHLRTLAPFVLSAVSQQEYEEQTQDMDEEVERDPQEDEAREAALVALEAFIVHCGNEMERFTDDTINAALRYVKYDLLVAAADDGADDEDVEGADTTEDDFELDEDFEEEGGVDDEDDVSWKVRRCATKTLHSILSFRGRAVLENSTTYGRVIQALIARFKEREESVRLEILSTLSLLIHKSGEGEELGVVQSNGADHAIVAPPQSRKRRRGFSDVSMADIRKHDRHTGSTSPEYTAPPRIGPAASLAKAGSDLVEGLLLLLKSSTTSSKQASAAVLKEYVMARHGGLDDVMDKLLEFLAGAVQGSAVDSKTGKGMVLAGTGAASDTNLQIEAMQLLSETFKAHSSQTFQAYLPKIASALAEAAYDKSPRVSCEALITLEHMSKALTPPRSANTSQRAAVLIEKVVRVAVDIIQARNFDLTVRQQALHVLGTIIGRTMGPQGSKLIEPGTRAAALELVYQASRNETTRYSAIKAINAIGLQSSEKKNGFDTTWLSKVCLELGQQLRKSDRSLRGASLDALRTLLVERQGCRSLSADSSQQITSLLVAVLVNNDLHLTGPALLILATLVTDCNIVDKDMNKYVCELVITPTAAPVIEQICILARSIGERGSGAPLMQMLLRDVGIGGNPTVVGKIIGNLLVSGMGNVGISLQDFLHELQTASDSRSRCLALSVLGEVGLRQGSAASGINPDLFMTYFMIKSDDVPLAAASALGRAAAGPGNVRAWVPAILSRIRHSGRDQYLLLHSIKELLHHNERDNDIIPFAGSLWDATISVANTDENRTIGAECLANLVMTDPVRFLPSLQSLLSNDVASMRAIAIIAFRDVFTVTDVSYNKDIRPVLVDVLTTMMRDSEVDNRRLSLNTFNAAARNKPEIILPQLYSLLPLVIDQSHKDPSLIREVQMGPFKHHVDDGLEVRKSAYETLYSLMEITPDRLDVVKLYDRAVAGVGDDRGIQALCNLMITKLIILAPEETLLRLDILAEQFKLILDFMPKETAVRPEIEKAGEAKKGVVKVSLELDKATPGSAGQTWMTYMHFMREKHSAMVKDVERKP